MGKRYPTVGFDVNAARVAALASGEDLTLEVSSEDLREAKQLSYSADPGALADCNFYIVTVPTPIGNGNLPELTPLRKACETISGLLKPGDVVVYESTHVHAVLVTSFPN